MNETIDNLFPRAESSESLLDFDPYFTHLQEDSLFDPFTLPVEELTPSPIFEGTEFPDLSVLEYDIPPLLSPKQTPQLPSSEIKTFIDSPQNNEEKKKTTKTTFGNSNRHPVLKN